MPRDGPLFATDRPDRKPDKKKAFGSVSGAGFRGQKMTDEKLHSLTENQLRALYNSAPEYLKSLLDRKRIMEEGIVWEMNIPQRAAQTSQ